VCSALVASLGIFGSQFAGDFFLGIDILVTSMLVNFLLMCVTVLTLPRRNPAIASHVAVLPSRARQVAVASAGVVLLSGFLVIHISKDLTTEMPAWYFHSTYLWIAVMALASLVYFREVGRRRAAGADMDARFSALPPE